jgi:prepilin-type N-terminal cleavage/methylation domain-containing protein
MLKQKTKSKTSPAFTLVELLAVTVIIGLLATVVLVSIRSLRTKTRDNERLATLKRLEAALVIYYNVNRAYPDTGGTWYSSEAGSCHQNGPGNNGNWIPGLAPNFIPILPKDPKGGASAIASCVSSGCYNAYVYRSDGIDYKLLSHCTLESLGGSEESSSSIFYDPARPSNAWQVHSSPNSLNW